MSGNQHTTFDPTAASHFKDQGVEGDEIVRSFMITGGRTRAADSHLSLETMVEPIAAPSTGSAMKFERQEILRSIDGPTSIAEIAATLQLPLLSTQVLVSDLVFDGVLQAFDSVTGPDLDMDILSSIRAAIVAL